MLREHFGPDAGVVSAKVMRYPDGTSRYGNCQLAALCLTQQDCSGARAQRFACARLFEAAP